MAGIENIDWASILNNYGNTNPISNMGNSALMSGNYMPPSLSDQLGNVSSLGLNYQAPNMASGGGGYGLSDFFGKDGKAGHAGLALNALTGVGNLFMGMKQYGLAKDTLAENKRQFALNFDAQQKLTNSQLADRQNARIQSSPGANFESTAEYMKKYGV